MTKSEALSPPHPSSLAEKAPATPARLTPTLGADRIVSVDVLRGVAILGILPLNVYAFGLPVAAYGNPLLYGTSDPMDLAVWFATHILFEQKFMTIFSMLFGASVVMMFERSQVRDQKMAGVFYRRNFWLLLIGLVHAYLIWVGDILLAYAVLGFVLFFFRRLRPRTLLSVGIPVLLLGLPVSHLMGRHLAAMEKEAQEAMAAGEERTAEQARTVEEWDQGMRAMLRPTAEDVAKDIEIHRGSYPEIVAHRAPIVVMANTLGFLTFGLWRLGGSMLIGMALMKLGVFSARRSVRFYTILLVWGYGLGLPLAVWSAYDLYRHAFDPVYMLELGMSFNWVGAVGVALGHVAVVMLAIKLGWLSALVACLASTGRMALTNYLSHSLLLTPIFYGYGLGLFGQIDRFALMGIVLAVWILQLWWSPLWLRHFRFGPLEWSWRRLTYWKL